MTQEEFYTHLDQLYENGDPQEIERFLKFHIDLYQDGETVNRPLLIAALTELGAFYRETKSKLEARKSEGCMAVEMELAGVQAVCDFYGFELYDFLATGDVLDQPVYDVSGLADANHNMDKLYIAIEIAKRII